MTEPTSVTVPVSDEFVNQWKDHFQGLDDAEQLFTYMYQLELVDAALMQAHKQYAAILKSVSDRITRVSLSEGQKSAKFTNGAIEVVDREVAVVKDWDAYYAWLLQDPANRIHGFLHKRAGSTAIAKHRDDTGELPDGTAIETISDIKVKTQQ